MTNRLSLLSIRRIFLFICGDASLVFHNKILILILIHRDYSMREIKTGFLNDTSVE